MFLVVPAVIGVFAVMQAAGDRDRRDRQASQLARRLAASELGTVTLSATSSRAVVATSTPGGSRTSAVITATAATAATAEREEEQREEEQREEEQRKSRDAR